MDNNINTNAQGTAEQTRQPEESVSILSDYLYLDARRYDTVVSLRGEL